MPELDPGGGSPLTETPTTFTERFYGAKKDPSRHPMEDPYVERERAGAEQRAKEADKAKESAEKQKRLGEQEQKQIGPQYEQLRTTLKSPHPQMPELQAPSEAPKPEDYKKMGYKFLGAMSVWAAFAGSKGRGAGNAALKGYTAMLNGWHEGNMENYRNAAAQWEQNTRRALAINNQKLEKYRMILEDRNMTIQEQSAAIKLTAAEFQDRISWDAADQNNYAKIGQVLDVGAASQKRLQEAYDKQIETLTAQDEMAQTHADQLRTPEGQEWINNLTPSQRLQVKGFLDAYPPAEVAATAAGTTPAPAPAAAVGASAPTPGGYLPPTEIPTAPGAGGAPGETVTGGAPAGWTSPIPPPRRPAPGGAQGWTWPKIDFLAAQSLRTGPMGMRAFANFPQDVRAAIQQRATEMAIAQGQTPGQVVAGQAGVKGSMGALQVLKKQEAAVDSYGRNMLRNGDVLLDLAKKVNKLGVPVLQRWVNAGKVSVAGDPDVAEFDFQLRLWVPEMARVATNPNLTGVLTEGARKEIASIIPAGANIAQFTRIMSRAHQDFENRRDTLKEEIAIVEGDISGEHPDVPVPGAGGGDEGWSSREIGR